MKKIKKTTPTKDHKNLLVDDPKDMEIQGVLNKKFKIALLGKLNELYETI